jgi:hypothetical protein
VRRERKRTERKKETQFGLLMKSFPVKSMICQDKLGPKSSETHSLTRSLTHSLTHSDGFTHGRNELGAGEPTADEHHRAFAISHDGGSTFGAYQFSKVSSFSTFFSAKNE